MAQCWLRYKKYSSQMGVDHVPLQDFTMDLVLNMTTEGMEVQLSGTRDSLTTRRSLPPPPPAGPFPRTPSRKSSLLHGLAKTDWLD